jgi:ribosomal protein L32
VCAPEELHLNANTPPQSTPPAQTGKVHIQHRVCFSHTDMMSTI